MHSFPPEFPAKITVKPQNPSSLLPYSSQREREKEERVVLAEENKVRETMSGWDEGAVYYSDQAQFPESGSDASAAAPSRHTILQKFKEFIRNFESKSNVFPYRESLVHNPRSLLVHLEDLLAFDAELPSLLRSSPADYLPLVTIIATIYLYKCLYMFLYMLICDSPLDLLCSLRRQRWRFCGV